MINVLYQLFEKELHEYARVNEEKVVEKISFTGMAASNIDGKTWHSFLSRGHGKIEGFKDISGAAKAESRIKLGPIQIIIEDEISLESSTMDNYMSTYLKNIFNNDDDPYGGKSVIKVGDFMQLKPYGGAPIYPEQKYNKDGTTKDKENKYGRPEINDAYVEIDPNRWSKYFKCFELSLCMRQKDDLDFAKILSIVRYMTIDIKTDLNTLPEDQKNVLNFLRSRVISQDHPDYPHTALHIFPTNRDVDEYNLKMIETVPGAIEVRCEDSELDQTGSFKTCEAKKAKNDFGLPKTIMIGVGARVMITKNQNVDDKIVNGTIGTVVAYFQENGVDTIWMRPDDSAVAKLKQSQLSSKKRKLYPNCIPIVKIESNISVANDSTYKRRQFPLKLCYAATIHKYQGRSLDEIVIGGFGSTWTQGMMYTALTRCRRADGLFLQDFNPNCLKANMDGLKEINRIRKHSMITNKNARLDFFKNYPPEKWMYICNQNVRSMSMHLEDVLFDPIMQASTILCLTETSLTDKNWSGWKNFSDFTVYERIRKQPNKAGVQDQRKSGGVAILVKKSIDSGTVDGVDDKDLEMISTVTEWAGELCHVSCIYKDHEMSKNVFIAKVNKVFETLENFPSIIAGDFNLHDDNNKSNDLLNSCAQEYGFVPMVDEGTTIHDHLLDQFFINCDNYKNESKSVILPSYFSDHSLVVLCIKK